MLNHISSFHFHPREKIKVNIYVLRFLHNSEELMINDTFNVVFNYTLLATNDHPRYLSVIENTSGSFSNSFALILTIWFEYTILVNVLQRFVY